MIKNKDQGHLAEQKNVLKYEWFSVILMPSKIHINLDNLPFSTIFHDIFHRVGLLENG
jgi:hypothetical protein